MYRAVCGRSADWRVGDMVKRGGVLCALCLLVAQGCLTVSRVGLAEEYYNIGNAYFELEQYNEAVSSYQRALELDSNLTRAEYNLAFAYLRLNRVGEAIALLGELLESDAENLLLQETLAYAYFLNGNIDNARSNYEAIIEQSPQRTVALYNLALIELDAGNSERVEELLARAHEVTPDDELVTYQLIEVMRMNDVEGNREMEVVELARALLESSSLSSAQQIEVGLIFENARFYQEALTLYERIDDEDTQYWRAQFRQAYISLTAIGEWEGGLEQLRVSIEGGYNDPADLLALYDNDQLLQKDVVEEIYTANSLEVEILRSQAAAAAAAAAAVAAAEAAAAAEDAAAGEGAEGEQPGDGAEDEPAGAEDTDGAEGEQPGDGAEGDRASDGEEDGQPVDAPTGDGAGDAQPGDGAEGEPAGATVN